MRRPLDTFVLRRSYPRFGVIPVVWAVQALIEGAPEIGPYTVTAYAVCTRVS